MFLRENAKLNQRQVAERSGLHLSVVNRLENGKGNPTEETLHRLAEGLGVPHGWISTLEDVFASAPDS